jgi:hypothetical protein
MIRRRVFAAVGLVTIAVSILVSIATAGNAYAAQTSTVGGNALKIAPVRLDLTMDPGTTKTIDVFITNLTSVSATLHAAVNDFSADGEKGVPAILLDENQSAPTHSLKQFVPPIGNFTLAPGQQKDVKVTIKVPKGVPGGGYYGAVRFYPPQASGDKSLNLAASVGSLVLLKVNGDIVEKMNVASFDVRRGDNAAFFFTGNKGVTSVVRFQNNGNVQLQPFGKIQLKRFGKPVAEYEVNPIVTDQRANVLPDSVRRFDIKLDKVSSFGKFTAEGNFGYGTTGQLLTAKATFYVVPVAYMVVAVVIIALLVLAIIILPRSLKAYNRRVIRRASRRR